MKRGTIRKILSALKSTSGRDFLEQLTLQLNEVIEADYTFIARVDKGSFSSTTLSMVAHGHISDNFTYSLEHTPCEDVSNDSLCVYPDNICSFYPKDQLLIDMKIQGYIGTPLLDSKGDVMGLVAALYENKIEDPELVTSLFELFTGRISAEIERMEHQAALVQLNNDLEQKVNERTLELQATLEQLKSSQTQLVENEKMAALGRLVAGVAHEVNTPLGAAILGNSTIESCYRDIKTAFDSGALSKQAFESNLKTINEAQETIAFNLARANDLITSFKQLATDFHIDELKALQLTPWMDELLSSLLPLLNASDITLEKHYSENKLSITTYPIRLAQVITNIVTNSVNHAFDPSSATQKRISIRIDATDSGCTITLQDNGQGMDEDVISKVFDPFFTTKRGSGGTGLGMSIARNLVNDSLKGAIEIESHPQQGTSVKLHIPSIE
jgi:signal transduction histidine kinase